MKNEPFTVRGKDIYDPIDPARQQWVWREQQSRYLQGSITLWIMASTILLISSLPMPSVSESILFTLSILCWLTGLFLILRVFKRHRDIEKIDDQVR